MSMTPADRSPTADPTGDVKRAAWTTTRTAALDCAGCGSRFVLSYKYRFVEGLAATVVRCPAAACRRGREYYLPVNAFDVVVTPAHRA
jgi:hypothetical protein